MDNKEQTYNLKDVIYSILFVAGDGVEKSFLAEKLNQSEKQVEKALKELEEELSGSCGVHLLRYKNKVQLSSNPNYATLISDVLNPIREKSLTRAALETLAIIAYKQPITKLEVEDVRRVNSDYAVQILLDQDMIEVVGRKDAVGKPLLFGTTDNFLKRFNIENLSDLPDYEELMQRIKTLRAEEEEETKSDSLFKDVQDLEFNEELPDFLKGENVTLVSGEKALEEKLASLKTEEGDEQPNIG